MTQLDPAQLAAVTQDLPDEEVNKAVHEMGVDSVLREIFSGMEERYLKGKTGGATSVVQYDIKTDEGVKSWTNTFTDEAFSATEGQAENPRLTISIGVVDFVRLIFGQVQGPQLFMAGKIRMQGDMMFAMQIQNFFDRSFQTA